MNSQNKDEYLAIAQQYEFYLSHEKSNEFSRAGFVVFLTEAYPDKLIEADLLFSFAEEFHEMLLKENEDILENLSSYSRKDSINDGNLVESPINEIVKSHGIRFHSASTLLLHNKIENLESDAESIHELYSKLVNEFKNAAKNADSDRLSLSMAFHNPKSQRNEVVEIDVFIGEGDLEETVLTFMLSHEG